MLCLGCVVLHCVVRCVVGLCAVLGFGGPCCVVLSCIVLCCVAFRSEDSNGTLPKPPFPMSLRSLKSSSPILPDSCFVCLDSSTNDRTPLSMRPSSSSVSIGLIPSSSSSSSLLRSRGLTLADSPSIPFSVLSFSC